MQLCKYLPQFYLLDNNKQCPPKSHVVMSMDIQTVQIISNFMCRHQSRHVHVVRTYVVLSPFFFICCDLYYMAPTDNWMNSWFYPSAGQISCEFSNGTLNFGRPMRHAHSTTSASARSGKQIDSLLMRSFNWWENMLLTALWWHSSSTISTRWSDADQSTRLKCTWCCRCAI